MKLLSEKTLKVKLFICIVTSALLLLILLYSYLFIYIFSIVCFSSILINSIFQIDYDYKRIKCTKVIIENDDDTLGKCVVTTSEGCVTKYN